MRQELSQLVKAVVNRRMAAVMVAAARWVEVVAVLRVMGEEKLAMEAMVVMVAVVVVVVAAGYTFTEAMAAGSGYTYEEVTAAGYDHQMYCAVICATTMKKAKAAGYTWQEAHAEGYPASLCGFLPSIAWVTPERFKLPTLSRTPPFTIPSTLALPSRLAWSLSHTRTGIL